jgi:quercetin dioxygenase-like cupin family protein/DNA-binding XRE family transcriptional regulator
MENQVAQVAQRIYGLRLILDISEEEMATVTGVSLEEYRACEAGQSDFSFTFLYKCAQRFGVDISELVTGEVPKLSSYTVVRSGGGMPIERRREFKYRHLAYLLKNRLAEPFFVTAKYSEAEQGEPIHLSTHKGQEFDFVLTGSMKFQIDGHSEILNPGDSVYYNSATEHGMIAVGGTDCEFLAIVMKDGGEEN